MAPQPRVAVHYSMEQSSPRALKAIASTHSPMYKPCMDAKCALALHMYRRGKTLPQWLSQTCCAAEPNYYRFLSQSQNTKTISFQYKTLLDTLSSSVDRVAAQCQETKVEWVQNKQTKEKKKHKYALTVFVRLQVWVQWNRRCTMPLTIVVLAGRNWGLDWARSEPSRST